MVDRSKFGQPIAQLRFDPNVNGLPAKAHQSYYFYVTEHGYVIPAIDDKCITEIYLNEWKAAADMYQGGSCTMTDVYKP